MDVGCFIVLTLPPVHNFAKIRARGWRGLLGLDHRDLRAPGASAKQSAKVDCVTGTFPWQSQKVDLREPEGNGDTEFG